MAKKDKTVLVFVTDDLNLKLKQYMLDLEKLGIHRTKADLIIKLAEVGLMYEQHEITIER